MNNLPPIKNKPIPEMPHFPSAMQALIFRLWDMVSCERLALVLKASEENVREMALEMGLGEQGDVSGWQEKGYISIIKAVWHLLPYEQLLELLDWTPERLAYVLKEDDFLNVKLGFFKFDCPKILYRPLTEAEHEGASRIREAIKRYAAPCEPTVAAKPFDFWAENYPPLGDKKKRAASVGDKRVCDYTGDDRCARFMADFAPAVDREIAVFLDRESEDEEYHELEISPDRIEIHAAKPEGVLRALLYIEDKADNGRLKCGRVRRTAAVKTRFIYSFCGLYGDVLDRDISISFPDGLLKSYAKCGVNGVWIQAVFSSLAPYPFDEELSRGWEKRLERLRLLTEKAARYGIKVYLYINEPRGMPQKFFETHPELKGRNYHDGLACLCTSRPEVREFLTNATEHICREVPLLGGFFNISMSENLTHCHSREMMEGDEPCPVCGKIPPEDVAADVIALMANAAHRINPEIRFFAWSWAWERFFSQEQTERLVAQLPKNVILMNVSESFLPFEKGGVRGNVMDYTLSMAGPSPWSKSVWEIARRNGLETAAKVQLNNSWECSTAPYLPVYETVIRHLDALAKENVSHLMLSWTLGGYPSETIKIASSYFFRESDCEDEDVYGRVLEEKYGEWADKVRRSVHCFSEGFGEFPFAMDTLYSGPQNLGAANLLYPEPTGLEATMTCFCYDDLKGWCGGIYTPEILRDQFAKICEKWEQGLEFIRDMPQCSFRDMAYYGYSLFKSSHRQICYIMNREKPDCDALLRGYAEEELRLAQAVYTIVRRNASVGYEAANHYYVTPAMLREKIISCAQML